MSDHLVIVQVRMGSSRLPGKAALDLLGQPLFTHTLDAILSVYDLSQLAVATSSEPASEIISNYCEEKKIFAFRGDEKNVASRFKEILLQFKPDSFSRINGDSPAFDVSTLSQALRLFKDSEADLVTTVGGGYPSGMNVEVINTEKFLATYDSFAQPGDFEHVTPFFYRHASETKINRLLCPIAGADKFKFSVDTQEDFERMAKLFKTFTKPHYLYSFQEKCKLYELMISEFLMHRIKK